MDEVIQCALCLNYTDSGQIIRPDNSSNLDKSLTFCSRDCLRGAEEFYSEIAAIRPDNCVSCEKEIKSGESYRVDIILSREYKVHRTCQPIIGCGQFLSALELDDWEYMEYDGLNPNGDPVEIFGFSDPDDDLNPLFEIPVETKTIQEIITKYRGNLDAVANEIVGILYDIAETDGYEGLKH